MNPDLKHSYLSEHRTYSNAIHMLILILSWYELDPEFPISVDWAIV